MAGRRSALIVACDQYADPKLKRLRSPSQDAAALARVLENPAIGNFTVGLSMNESEAIIRRKLSTFFTTAGREDLLVLHVACHGVKDEDGNLYFAATDTESAELLATAVQAEYVERLMQRSPSRRIVLLLDCCYSGAFARGMRARGDPNVQVLERLTGRGRAVLTASSAMEYAWEGDDLAGVGLPSVFTGAVVQGLRTGEADLDGDGQISVDELYDYVLEKVHELMPQQTPNKQIQVEGELVIAESVRGPRPAPPAADQLPAALLQATESPFADLREGAVTALLRLARTGDPELARLAETRLRALADDDSRSVSTKAAAALSELRPDSSPGMSGAGAPPAAGSRTKPVPVPVRPTPPPAAVERPGSVHAAHPVGPEVPSGREIQHPALLGSASLLVGAWALAQLLFAFTLVRLGGSTSLFTLLLGGAFSCAVGGGITGAVLQRETRGISRQGLAYLAGGWALAGGIGCSLAWYVDETRAYDGAPLVVALIPIIVGAIGGYINSIIIRQNIPNIDINQVIIMTLGWLIGWLAFMGFLLVLDWNTVAGSSEIGYVVRFSTGGAVLGLVGGGVMLWQVYMSRATVQAGR
jgi:Caspase domain